MNVFDQMRQALSEARDTFRAADSVSHHIADMLVGRLKHVSPYTLAKLKRELRDFNAHTKEWK